jgi:hypothetical protein
MEETANEPFVFTPFEEGELEMSFAGAIMKAAV